MAPITETNPNLIQGGVSQRARKALLKQLAECKYKSNDPNFSVTLFSHWNESWDATPFDGPKTEDPNDFVELNIHAVKIHDPTHTQPWHISELRTFFRIVDKVAKDLRDGKTVIVACVMGKNRSKAVQYALHPTDENKPECTAMLAAAQAYRNNDESVVPLAPERTSRAKRGRDPLPNDDV